MVCTAGVVRVPNFATERILKAIAEITTDVFTVADIATKVPDLPYRTVHSVLRRKARQGGLAKVAYGRYRRGGTKLQPQKLPLGLVAQSVWLALSADTERFMRLGDIVGAAEVHLDRPGVSIYHATCVILYYWYRSGHLERTGERGEYAYRLAPGVTARPILRP